MPLADIPVVSRPPEVDGALRARLERVAESFECDAGGMSRREFIQYCLGLAALLALPPSAAPALAEALVQAPRPSVIWLSFQECTACTESLTRCHEPGIEALILSRLSLDYHHTLQAASGEAAEWARETAMREHWGRYLLVVDGAIPTRDGGVYSTFAGRSNLDLLHEVAKGAAAVVAVGNCAAFGGLPAAQPNPTGAVGVSELVRDRPLVNVPGCPPVPGVIAGVLAHWLAFKALPELDDKLRPLAFYAETVHERCYRRSFYFQGKFAKAFDDEGARQGWCLYELGCKGPWTRNACASLRWNDGTSFPIASGHGCIGCSEPGFWDAGGLYRKPAEG